MARERRRSNGLTDSALAQHLEELEKRYRAAWQSAAAGGEPPRAETFLHEIAESDRPLMQDRLREIDATFRHEKTEEQGDLNTTVDLSNRNATSDTAKVGPNALDQTIDSTAAIAGDTSFEVGAVPGAGRYEILGELGRGGMGVVYKARQKGLNRLVALKMLLAGAHADDILLQRFNTEAEAVARLHHPNIVQIYEVGQMDGVPYFSLEFVDGQGLNKKLGGKPQPFREAAELMMVLARAMHYAHEHQIIHRDLKPGNILLTSAGVPKIADFGLAKRLEGDISQTRSGTLMGTPGYMAPEQARGENHDIGPAADTYALGAILYELLTGRAPFVAAGVMETIMRVLKEEPVPPSQLRAKLPPDLETICLKCLQKEPPRRYASAGAMADDLDHYLAGEPILARPVGVAERLWRWCRRNPRVAALTASTFALLVAGIVGLAAGLVAIAKEKNKKEEERRAADEARQSAEVARELAQRQTMLSLETIRTLVREVQEQIGNNPGMQRLKLKLLETALESLERVPENDETWRLQGQITAGAYVKVGETYLQLGDSEQAFKNIEKGRKIIQQMADREPQGDVAQANLAAVHVMLGRMSMELRRDMQAALVHHKTALKIRRELNSRKVSEKLDAVKVKKDLAESYQFVGIMHLKRGDPRKARGYFQDGLAIRQELAAATPNDSMPKLDVALSFNALAEVEFRDRLWPEARQSYEKALALNREVYAKDQNNPTFKGMLAITLGNYGDFALRTGDLDTASQHYSQYLALYEALADSDGRNADYQRWLGLANYRMGTLARKQSDSKTAERSNQACLKIREALAKADAKSERKRNDLLLILPRCGQHARAAGMAAEIEKGDKVDRELLVVLAQCYAQCAAAVPEQEELKNRYSAKALEALNKALASGYADLVFLETEPDLGALQGRPEFTSLLARFRKGPEHDGL
jgi:serine/threonine-protein kinase